MKTALAILGLLFLSLCANCPQAFAACDEVPAGQTLLVRLIQPVSSYSSKAGTPVRGILIDSPQCEGAPLLPEGAVVEGRLKSVHRVGLGFRHEVASLEIEFTRITPYGGEPIEIHAQVVKVENAREKIRNGVIHGIRSTNSPQDHLTSRLEYFAMWSPTAFWILPMYKTAVPFAPEPEIHFPAGTDFRLELEAPVPAANRYVVVPANAEFSAAQIADMDARVAELPQRTATPQGIEADIVNLVFLGSREQLEDAFKAAGWLGSDPMTAHTAFREIGAFMMVKGYPRGPMSTQVMAGKPQDMKLQKGLDSLALRDHLRVWNSDSPWLGQTAWVASSTQDIGATFSARKARFFHHVDGDIDEERNKVVRDLSLAGCVGGVHDAPRPDMPRFLANASGDEIRTDGAVAVIQLQDCANPLIANDLTAVALPSHPPAVVRYIRTQVLSFRDLWRENAAYGLFDIGRASVRAIRRKHEAIVRARQTPAPVPMADPGAALSN